MTFHDTSWGSEQALWLLFLERTSDVSPGRFCRPGLVPWVQSQPLLQSGAGERRAVATQERPPRPRSVSGELEPAAAG